MSRIRGPIRQNAHVVTDFEAAMRRWSEVPGLGPWFYVEHAPVTGFVYRGGRVRTPS